MTDEPIKPKRGRPTREVLAIRKALEDGTFLAKKYKNAMDWAMERMNDPDEAKEFKRLLATLILPFQLPRIEHVKAPGKKEVAVEAAKEATPTPFEPATAPAKLKVV